MHLSAFSTKLRVRKMHPSFLLLALDSPFSRPVLQTLLDAGQPPAALLLPNPDRTALPHRLSLTANEPANPLTAPLLPSITQLASQHSIPTLTLGNLHHPETLQALQTFQPDFLLTACFPRLLPAEILAIPRLGALNLHPSLLPAYRGPEPLFWQFYYGVTSSDATRTGITLHFMDEKADTGDIIAQAEVPFPDGISLAQAETLTAQTGADLVRRAFSHPENLPRSPQFNFEQNPLSAQDTPRASYHPRPTLDEMTIPTTWAARRAYNFIRAVREWGPIAITDQVTGQSLRVREAVGYVLGSGAVPPPRAGQEVTWLSFTDGIVGVIEG